MKRLLGFYLRGLRGKSNKTLEAVAGRLGFTNPVFLSSIEIGRRAIPISRILDFQQAYNADRLFFPRAVLFLWHGETWNLFKEIVHYDKTWTYSDDEDSWYATSADSEIRYFLVKECKELLDHYRPKDRTILLSVLREYHDTPCVEPPLPLSEQPSYLEKCRVRQEEYEHHYNAIDEMRQDFLKKVKVYIRRHGKKGLKVPKWLDQ